MGFYDRLRVVRHDDADLASCIQSVVKQLDAVQTSDDRPGMLLGRIQSGKTRCFLGVIALAFDRGYTAAVVMTKGTKSLTSQTVARLQRDFREFVDDDEFLILDIMKIPEEMTKNELKRKLVIVAKKQVHNLDRLITLFDKHEELHGGKVLLIDDEADLASVRFVRTKNQTVEQGKIAQKLDNFRQRVGTLSFLQVTATPYSLYLQPEDYQNSPTPQGFVYKPKRPAFTELLPIHSAYVGGNDYFGVFDDDDPRERLFVPVANAEQDALRRPDQRRIRAAGILDNPNTTGLGRAIATFILGVVVRRWQQREAGEKQQKYAMVIHNDTQRTAHAWQQSVIDWIFEAITAAADSDPDRLRDMFDLAYDDLSKSVAGDNGKIPGKSDSYAAFLTSIRDQDITRQKVNSDADVLALLDENSELRLRTPGNIFVGGNILDRGITIPNMISFYYGRNPRVMQADTVLQHSRMYGARNPRDLAVTRFFTTRAVYDRLYKINQFENALRDAFESGLNDKGVVFIQADARRQVVACAPNKVLLSDVVTVRPNSIYLPTSFTIVSATKNKKLQQQLDGLIERICPQESQYYIISFAEASSIIDLVRQTMEFDAGEFDWDAMKVLTQYYTDQPDNTDKSVQILKFLGRSLSKERSGDRTGLSILGTLEARQMVTDTRRRKPALVLLRQAGTQDLGWSGTPFWWPMLAAPPRVEPVIFAARTAT